MHTQKEKFINIIQSIIDKRNGNYTKILVTIIHMYLYNEYTHTCTGIIIPY